MNPPAGPGPEAGGHGRAAVLGGIALLALFLPAWWPALGNGFTNWDDQKYILANPVIGDLSWGGIKSFFTTFQLANYHPLTLLAHAIEYRFFGLHPAGYHMVSLLFHLANSLLVVLVTGLLGCSPASSMTAAFLFALHPLHVESVAWISELKDVLSSFFFLASLAAYLKRARRGYRGRGLYALSLAFFLLALLAKPMAVTLPLVMLAADHLLGRRIDVRSLREKAPFLALAGVGGAISLLAQESGGALWRGEYVAPWEGLFVAAHGLVFYLAKLALPVNLSAFYPYPARAGNLLPWNFLLSPLPAAVLLAALFHFGRRSRRILFGGLFYLLTLLPVLQLVPLGYVFAADRYTYLPSIGIFYLAGEGLAALLRRPAWRTAGRAAAISLVLAALAGTLATLTRQRTLVWRDSLTLWNDVLRQYPDAFMALGNRGNALAEAGELDLALRDFDLALSLTPDRVHDARIYYNRGLVRQAKGEDLSAVEDFTRALRVNPGLTAALLSRARAYRDLGRDTLVVADSTSVLAADKSAVEAYYLRARALERLGRREEAEADWRVLKHLGFPVRR